MLQMYEGLRLRADPAFPRTASALGACAQRFGACLGRIFEVCIMCWPDCRELPCTESCRIHRSRDGSGERGRCGYIKSVAFLPNMRVWRPINEPAWPSRLGSPHRNSRKAALQTAEQRARMEALTAADATPHAAQLQAPKQNP